MVKLFLLGVLLFLLSQKIENPLLYPFRISPLPTRARKIVSKVDEWGMGLIDFADYGIDLSLCDATKF